MNVYPGLFRHFILTVAAACACLSAATARANLGGSSAGYTLAFGDEATCTACHSTPVGGAAAGSVSLTGLPAAYKTGTTYPLTVTVNSSGGTRFGFQLTALDTSGNQAGNLANLSSSTQLKNTNVSGHARQYIEHRSNSVFAGSWTFNWTAPSASAVSFYMSGLRANNLTNSSGDSTYNKTNALVKGVSPAISTQPTSMTILAGSNVLFVVAATGTPSPGYQWRFNGANIAGATASSYTRSKAQMSDSGSYTVVVTNIIGSNTSSTAVLTVNAVPNSVYNGLFYEAGGVNLESSGFFTTKTTSKGTFSGKLLLAGKSYSSKGLFNAVGRATNVIARTGLSPLTVELKLDFSGKDQITGRVTDGSWSADLTADKALFNAVTNPAPQAGRYTMHIPGNPNPAESPGGDGFGTVTVDAAGKIALKGILGDGTKISQKTSLSKNGQWPFYASLYKGGGSIISWVTFTNSTPKVFGGATSWIKKANALAKFYAGGFSNDTATAGSFYTPPLPGNRVLNFSSSMVLFTGGNLSQSFSNSVTLGTDNKVINHSSNKFSLTITLPTGLFKGKVTDPASAKSISYSGALSQKENAGFGFFLGTNRCGNVDFRQ